MSEKPVIEEDPFKGMDEEKLKKLPVLGKKGLRAFIVKNNIFKGIGNLKKQQLIDDVLVSKWWRDNISGEKTKPLKKGASDEEKATKKEKEVKDLSEALKKRQKLQNELRDCESRISKKNKGLAEKDDEISKLNKLIEESSKKKKPKPRKKKSKKKKLIERPDNLKLDLDEELLKLIPKLDDAVDELDETQTKKDEMVKEIQKIIEKSDIEDVEPKKVEEVLLETTVKIAEVINDLDDEPEKDKEKAVEEVSEVITNWWSDNNLSDFFSGTTSAPPPAPPLSPKKQPAKPIETQTEPQTKDAETQTDSPNERFITHKEPQRRNIDNGHTIVNMYCGGNNHPDFPVPQSVVRQALDANQQPLFQQQQVGEFLREQQQPPQQSLSSLKSKFNAPVRKFETVKSADRIQKKQDKPPVSQKTTEQTTQTEPRPKSRFEDDSDEEEDEADRLRRLRREEIAREFAGSKKKGFSEAFKARLSEKLGVGKKK